MSHEIEISVDGEKFGATAHKMTPNQILAIAGLAAATHYLLEIMGKTQKSLEGKGEEEVSLNKNSKFVSVFTGPTTVSDCGVINGVELFSSQLEKLGYSVDDLGDGQLVIEYVVEFGSHAGEEVKLGFNVPSDFPLTPPPGPHVSPHIHPLKSGGEHPTGQIIASASHGAKFGPDFQYWSRPFPEWAESRRTASGYMAYIRHLWASQ